MRHLLIEEAHPIITDFLADFCAFACEKLGLTTCPPITFVEHTGNASFGSYSPSEGTVIVATSGRHAADILRTLAHEFVHEQQIKSGSEQTLIEMEYEANAIAGLLMREYNQLHPGLYGVMDSVGVENDTDEHESFGATAADPTRPSGPINMAEAKIQDTDTDKLKMLKLGNQALRAFPSSPRQHAIQKQIEMLRDKMKREGTPEYHTTLNEDAPENADGDEGESMGATFADPTRPTGPVGFAEDRIGDYGNTWGLDRDIESDIALAARKPNRGLHALKVFAHGRAKAIRLAGTKKPITTFGMTAAEKAKKNAGHQAAIDKAYSISKRYGDNRTRLLTPKMMKESAKAGHVGTCVNSFSKDTGECTTHLPYRDTSHFASSLENSEKISKAHFEKHAQIPKHLEGVASHKGTDFYHDKEHHVHMMHDTKRDVHHFFTEDAPVNAAGSGEIAGIGIGPQGEPGIKKSKMIRRKPKNDLAKIFSSFPKPKKLFKEYKATITKRLNWDKIDKDKTPEASPLGTLGLPHKNMRLYNAWQRNLKRKSFKQFMKED
jgi:hypothetical protein